MTDLDDGEIDRHEQALNIAREKKRYPATTVEPFGRNGNGIAVKGDFHARVANALRDHGFSLSHRAGNNVIFWPRGGENVE